MSPLGVIYRAYNTNNYSSFITAISVDSSVIRLIKELEWRSDSCCSPIWLAKT